MVDGQVRTSDVTDQRIIEAMLTVPRESFVPDGKAAMAYLDLDFEVGENRFLLKPVVVARLLQAAEIRRTDTVLVVGCASGYTAAVAAMLAHQVRATDPDAALVACARASLDKLGLTNV
ncbi:MAG: protein-L-isoaspartate O-methyltransferase, partial [Rhizobiales bacterium]|nr:protein-L-isoaspartate O-methyltransferase [Hyphomicrobiales bacterium]